MSLYKNFFAVVILASFLFPVFSNGQKAEKEEPVKIPEEVTKVIETNLPARQARLDIHLSYVHTLYFPYQADYFACFFLKIKNKALGYVTPFMEEKNEKAREKGKKEAEKEAEEEEKILSCNVDFFFRIYSLGKDGQIKSIHKEIYLPWGDQVESEEYNPEEENIYSFGTIFPPGHYLLSAAAASLDLTKIGLIFQEFYLPFPSDFKKNLGLTPLFFVKSIKRMPSPDSVIKIYKNLFHYAVLEIELFFDHEFSLTEKLDIFYLILGGAPAEDGKYKFEVNYVYKKGEEEIVKFEPKMLDIPATLVSQPLPLFFKTKKLEPGEYILEITIKDKIGKKEGLGKINFIIK